MKKKLLLVLCLTSSSTFCIPPDACVLALCAALTGYVAVNSREEVQKCCNCPNNTLQETASSHTITTEKDPITTQPGTTND